ncbi:MAG: TonB-dependent receptor [Pyrinomonadaceae bacterium]|nr:TonB-dependent receptor [Pyrinomonadaceae bacterium]
MNLGFIKSLVFPVLTLFVFSTVFVVSIMAQAGTSTISGTVTDQTGAAVPGAKVTLNNAATGFTRSTIANEDGSYSFPAIPPATYQLVVEQGNFKKTTVSGLQALVDQKVVQNIRLEAGDVTARVDITSNMIESLVNTQDASIGNTFVPKQIEGLPTNLRRVQDLMTLQPGVTRTGYVAGGRSDQANITLDGIDINDQQTGGRDGATEAARQFSTSQGSALRATTESVEEFRITTVNANANQGRSSGAQISLVTRSGTNDFHGAGFYFYRPTEFSANNFFNNLAGVERPSLARDVFGGRIGGPIFKDKLFFFYTYEGQRQTLEQSVNRLVPLPHMGQGQINIIGTRPGDPAGTAPYAITLTTADLNGIYNQLPDLGGGMRVNPAAIAAFAAATARYPSNNADLGDGINTGGFRFNSPRTISENTHIARIDYNINDNQLLFARYNWQWDISSGTSQFPDTPATNLWDHPNGVAVGHNWTIGNNKINNIRFGLTKQTFSNQGDSADNDISFRLVFDPRRFVRTLSRTTNTYNITDDFTWIKGNHTLQFGGNVRFITNRRNSLGAAFDSAVTNSSFYAGPGGAGSDITLPLTNAGYTITPGSIGSYLEAATGIIGRYTQYTANYTFDIDGNILPAGTSSTRNFATQELDVYAQDSWRLARNLTLTLGLRYALSRPVYETGGFQVVPDIPLGTLLERRIESARNGVATNDLVTFILGGPKNNAPGFYSMDWNDWQPRVAVAWSPNFQSGFLKKLFGPEGTSTIRGGFAITNDSFGQQLAVSYDGLSLIGFTGSSGIGFGTYNTSNNPGPLFTGFDQDIRALPGLAPGVLNFVQPNDGSGRRIQTSLDATIVSPQHWVANVSYGRNLPRSMYIEGSYIYRRARNLGATRDVVAWNNIVDTVSGMDYYTAAGMLEDLRFARTPLANIAPIPYFENLFPNAANAFVAGTATQNMYAIVGRVPGTFFADFTVLQQVADLFDWSGQGFVFGHPQYDALSGFGTSAKSDYHGATLSLRQRLGETLSYDVNYTYSISKDNASGLQTGNSYGSQFITNAILPNLGYGPSDFDTKHNVNANFLFNLPFGKGAFLDKGRGLNLNSFIGGWQLAGVYRFNTGRPTNPFFDNFIWNTNWNSPNNTVRVADPGFGVNRDTRNAFANQQAAWNSFRTSRPGEIGDRNAFRGDNYQTLDLGLTKNIPMPFNENHKLQLRWEVFNVFNLQYFEITDTGRATAGMPWDPNLPTSQPSGAFGRIYGDIQGSPRSMQFGVRYEF